MEKLLLNTREVAVSIGLKESTVRNWHQGKKRPPPNFPPARKTGAGSRCVRWLASEIVEYASNLPIFEKPMIETSGDSRPVAVKSLRGPGRPRKLN